MRDFNVDQIKKLWLLELIIQSGSLKRAASTAKVTPSAISQSLTSLEKSIGRPLLIRNRGAVEPTQDALAVLEIVRPAFEAFEKLKNVNNVPIPELSWLNFGTYESLAIDFLPGFLHSLRSKLPHTKLGVRISRTENLLTMLRKGELCSALIAEVDELDKFFTREVCRDRLGIFVSRRHGVAEHGWKALDELGYGSLMPGRSGLPRYMNRYVRQFGSLKPVVLSDSFEVLRAGAAAGSFAAILPTRVALRNDDLIEIMAPKSKGFLENGEHRLLVASLANCDRAEVDFLADEAKRLLKTKAYQLDSTF